MTHEPGSAYTDDERNDLLREEWNEATWWKAQGKLHKILMWYAIRYLGGKNEVGIKPWKAQYTMNKENNG